LAKVDWNFYFGILSFKDGAKIENSILTFDSDSEVTIEDSIVVLPPVEGESETNVFNLLKQAENVETSKQLLGYTGVRVYAGTDEDGNQIVFEAGDTSGTVLEVTNELMGSQEMADNILADIRGLRYQPLIVDRGLLDPSADMGDGISVNGVFSGIYTRSTTFGRLMASDVSAPTEEEIDHEFAMESPSDRQYTRFLKQTKAMLRITAAAIDAEVNARTEADEEMSAALSIQATEIAARVTQTGGDNSSFGWSLLSNEFGLYSGNNKVFYVNSSGAHVNGEITATSGKIGGFDIKSNYLSYNNMNWNSNQTNGIYLGTSGFRLGQKFKVDTAGNVTASGITATSMVLKGTLTFDDGNGNRSTLNAYTLRQGAAAGYNWSNGSYGGYSSQAAYALGGAGSGFTAKTFTDQASDINVGVKILNAKALIGNTLSVGGYQATWQTRSIKNSDGNTITIYYLGFSD